jgi:nucleotide-binding universal stress UspA family protein
MSWRSLGISAPGTANSIELRSKRCRNWRGKRAEEKLDEICTLHLDHCPLYIRHTAVGDPANEILKLVEKERADLVVIASRGRKSRFDFGSVAVKIVRHSLAPVLVIPAR